MPRLMPTYLAAYCWNRSPITQTNPASSSQKSTSRLLTSSLHSAPGPLEKLTASAVIRSEEHTSELQSQSNLVCRLLLEKKKQEYDQQQKHTNEHRKSTDSQ